MPSCRGVKVAVVGAGSTYTPELVDGLLRRREALELDEIALVDPDRRRLAVIGPLAERMIARAGGGVTVSDGGADLVGGVRGARFVVSQIRVGGQAARDADERLGREFDLIGQETVGVGGLANALRTIPVALAIARTVADHAPGAILVNFTNPAGLVTEALCRHGPAPTIGLCNAPWGIKAALAETFTCRPEDIQLDHVGLNHLGWVRGVTVAGDDRTSEALAAWQRRAAEQVASDRGPCWTPEAIGLLGSIPNDYLLYYYETPAMLAAQARRPTRASEVLAIEEALLLRYADPGLSEKPPELDRRGGAHYSEAAAALMADIATDADTVHVIDVQNRGAIPGLADDVVVEVSARVDAGGMRPLPVAPLRADMDALVRTMKDVELLTVEAAVHGDEVAAMRALAAHPLGPGLNRAAELWRRLREVNAGLLGPLDTPMTPT
jgi:6-phospho-beta-glucosidase